MDNRFVMRPLSQSESEVSIFSMQFRVSHILGTVCYFKGVVVIKIGIYFGEVAQLCHDVQRLRREFFIKKDVDACRTE